MEDYLMRYLSIVPFMLLLTACGSKAEYHALEQSRWAANESTGDDAGPIPNSADDR